MRCGRCCAGAGARWTFAAAASATGSVLARAPAAPSHVQRADRGAERASAAVLAARPRASAPRRATRGARASNPRLRLTVVPDADAGAPSAQRAVHGRRGARPLRVCAFGAPGAEATATVALIGDSHASHWRAALTRSPRRGLARPVDHAHRLPVLRGDRGDPPSRPAPVPAVEPRGAALAARATARSSTVFVGRASPAARVARRAADQCGRRRSTATCAPGARCRAPSSTSSCIRDTPKCAARRRPPASQRAIDAHRRRGAGLRAAARAAPWTATRPPSPPRTPRRDARRRRRPDALHLRRAPLLPGDRRRARLQGRAPPDDGLRHDAGAVLERRVDALRLG